ncbi:MazG nucleotide pyrophosphohydrolase domain-containing protein [Sporomusa acidovorans]|uniref:NTP pyrophosphohydrolase MazG-like domain-containing protein n=1 Tax=Sporomusa acidovorans (strain ATCC 49682 / DSM 3132 / Mol) TaxID=1123286 RepID=A0ABZ3J8P4_SPOA4|nr:MazG nucleotide pyrophosphohydrolase domain-containing protein [Sporomusa acidovorans]OZC21193.1 MazG nucleotide pyrophosphohydrolase domain protein [Sporomusa acidovorans DSM 3132]SDE64373.1 MazG nucleotide pyrophosphohydrolase domain-containing protein [Sporomusa acidovorans]
MVEAIYLPKLNNLNPTLDSTLLKAMEEAGELARAVLKFIPWEKLSPAELAHQPVAAELLNDVKEELLDVAQTCVTMIFVMEDNFGIDADSLIGEHLAKLIDKGYAYDDSQSYRITTIKKLHGGNYKYISLPHLELADVTLLTTVCKIQEELGELTQFLGKHAGASGEQARLTVNQVNRGAALELLDVAQCCFTMMYILAQRHAVHIPSLVAGHVDKLRRKGYCR